ncbi:hypothetical protein [Oceanisphaera sp. KMM 10153]|uniref:hypothetical protein n=1 Tax=Oceanisphaera submarina TaxID=3390193 RepID=UPI003976C15B
MFLIMSGAYVGQELESEFGLIPPSFLPLGNRRLFQHQVALASKEHQVYLSIPESFEISSIDLVWLEENNVDVIMTPDGLSLGASLVAAVNISGYPHDKPLHVLYGDTLFQKLPFGDDIVSVSQAKDCYNWAVLTDDCGEWLKDHQMQSTRETSRIIDGYFKFSQPKIILKCITQSEWNFIRGLNRYHQAVGLTPVHSSGWLDFGHVNTYYRSKAEFTTQRAFNELTITPHWIEKSSSHSHKITAEANWFSNLPYPLRGYIPQFLGYESASDGKVSYRLEYLHHTALNELFVFARLPSPSWRPILKSCIDFLTACRDFPAPEGVVHNTLDELFRIKTLQRLNDYCQHTGIELSSRWSFNGASPVSLQTLLQDSNDHLPPESSYASVLHGDFCFSNILYDFRAGKIKTIDPRGMTSDKTKTLYGDTQYDIAKLSHSVLGLYDWIMAGYYQVDIHEEKIFLSIAEPVSHKDLQQEFIELIEHHFDLSASHLYAMQIQLFLSMLPLHADDPKRQKALFANAFRLHQILTRLKQ